jgi:hypothetical protein
MHGDREEERGQAWATHVMSIVPIDIICSGRAALYMGDGSERCVVCGDRSEGSYYVGQFMYETDEGLPERYPVCDVEHAYAWMRYLWGHATKFEGIRPMM